ncbi:MAG: hypothetical protein IT449_01475 [Phycisphaerales bacterium]|nr:hypothetical protein [Phycisphaerales bacterium]
MPCPIVTAQPDPVRYVFQPTSGTWNFPGSWEPIGPPDANGIAVIGNGKTCTMNGQDGEALFIEIDGQSTTVFGALVIPMGSTLTLHGAGADEASTVNGTIKFDDGEGSTMPELHVLGDHRINKTVNSLDDNIVGTDALRDEPDEDKYGLIAGASNAKLTLGSRNTSGPRLSMIGNFKVEVALENNGNVNANPQNLEQWTAKIRLTDNAKTGVGTWKATYGELIVETPVTDHGRWIAGTSGTLLLNGSITSNSDSEFQGYFEADYTGKIIVNAPISGSAPWTLKAGGSNPDPFVDINYPCTRLSGNIVIHAGRFNFDANFCTTGELDVDGGRMTGGVTSPAIVVKFSQGCP